MALLITEQCINCDVCEPVCPNQAIRAGTLIYEIRFDHCTECVGHFDAPQCVAICPVDCIEIDASAPETRQQLEFKYCALVAKELAA